MKKLSILILALVALTGFNACSSDDDVVFIAQPDPDGISFRNTFSSTYILTDATAANNAERFVWNELDMGVPTNIMYEVQGSTSSDFSDFTVLGTTSDNNLAITVRQLMDLAEDAGLDNDPDTEAPNTGTIFVRVVASAGTGGEMLHTSEAQALTVMLPELTGEPEITFQDLYLVGDATASGWTNTTTSNNHPLFRDPTNPDIYYYTGKFNAGNVKVIEERGAWAPQYGGENGNLIYRPTEADPDPAAIPVPSAGYYTFTIDVDAMTYTLVPYDASGAATYATIGYIGSATAGGWDADADMTQSAFDPHLWYAKGVQLMDGELKFRAGDAWDVNWGADTPLAGKATMNGPNIPVEENTYEIWFNDLTGRYILIPPTVEE